MSNTTAPTVQQFTMADLVKVITADTGGRHGSIRRAMSALDALGVAPQLPASDLSDADLFTGIVAPVHFFAPHVSDGSGYLSACEQAGKVIRTGRRVTCEACKSIHRASVAADVFSPADVLADEDGEDI
jgi:hypothetical protein